MEFNEIYVSFYTAIKLKQAGFDWKCRKCYDQGVMFDMESDEIRAQVPQHSAYDIPAPTLAVAQRWLSEKYNLHFCLIPNYRYDTIAEDSNIQVFIGYILECYDEWLDEVIRIEANTYEDALEAGINKCLTLILMEDENN